MKNEFRKNLNDFKNSGATKKSYHYSIEYDGGLFNDFDLHNSIGKVDYSMTITKSYRSINYGLFTRTEVVYTALVTVSDYYNFDEYRNPSSFSNKMNNWGYNRQKDGIIKPYYWDATFVYQEFAVLF